MICLINKTMKYIFRGHTVFEYKPNYADGFTDQVILHYIDNSSLDAFNYCRMIPEDYKLLSQFFDTVYRHIGGEDIELKDIEVY